MISREDVRVKRVISNRRDINNNMAWREDVSDQESQKGHTCHTLSKVKLNVCIICENVYYASAFIVSKIFVICPENQDIDLTAKLNSNKLKTIAKIIILLKLKFKKRKMLNRRY